jgi:TonB family protein
MGLSSGFQPPRKTRDVKPKYPEEALKERRVGTVVVAMQISEKGCVTEARLVQGPRHLSWAALRAVLGFRFAPATLRNEPIPFDGMSKLTFSIR